MERRLRQAASMLPSRWTFFFRLTTARHAHGGPGSFLLVMLATSVTLTASMYGSILRLESDNVFADELETAAGSELRVGLAPHPPLVIDYGGSGEQDESVEGSLGLGNFNRNNRSELDTSNGSAIENESATEKGLTSDNTRFGGIAVELFEEIALAEDLDFRFYPLKAGESAELLTQGDIDVQLAVVPQADRVGELAYTQPFLTTHLAAMTRDPGNSIWKYAGALLNQRFWSSVLWLSVLLLVVGTFCWLLERSVNSDQFRRRPTKGIWDGFYWAGVTMSTIGYGDQTPKSNAGRILALLWMLIAMAVTSTLTASIVSVVGRTDTENSIRRLPEDLRGKRIAVARGSYAASYLQEQGIQFETEPSLSSATQSLTDEKVDVVVGMRAALAAASPSAASESDSTLSAEHQMTTTRLKPQGYAMAVSSDRTELLARLNRQLLKETRRPEWDAKVSRFLKSDRDR